MKDSHIFIPFSFYTAAISAALFSCISFSVTTQSYRHADSAIPAASAVMVMLLQPSARKGRLEKWLNWKPRFSTR